MVRHAFVIALSAIGFAFSLSGVVGIVRMPDLYSRVQCSSKTITMGALPALAALVVAQGPVSTVGSRALVVAALLLVANPMSSHALVRAAYRAGVPMEKGAFYDQGASRRAALEEQESGPGAVGP